MAKRTGVRALGGKHGDTAYTPDSGDLIWLSFSPQAGREQAGRRPGFVLSPRSYNAKVGLCLVCPVTHQTKGYAFEVALPDGLPVQGVVLADHVKSADWRERKSAHIAAAPAEVLEEVRAKLKPLLGI
ncbi:MAG: endoribonuclease MazF [Gemmataceae bacterium]|nr:endoribonuclease MazF [Gemmataceae bacterium]MCI0742936.1 endoribonuclease MazF [Gemmataceae bacterium]